jgi:hypothetical protein
MQVYKTMLFWLFVLIYKETYQINEWILSFFGFNFTFLFSLKVYDIVCTIESFNHAV